MQRHISTLYGAYTAVYGAYRLAWVSIVNISPSFPLCIIYDDASHLIRRLIDGQLNNKFNITPAILYSNTKIYNIDCLHIANHTDRWCRKHFNPETNPGQSDAAVNDRF